jgi:hypothetical protein
MKFGILLLRLLSAIALAIWIGGFTFYSAVVIPILHEQFSSAEAGMVTARVTDALNLAGGITIALWWLLTWVARRAGETRRARLQIVLVGLTTILLGALIVLHHVMDRHLASEGLQGFYGLHRAYLIVSTVQWLANLALLASTVVLRTSARTQEGDRSEQQMIVPAP